MRRLRRRPRGKRIRAGTRARLHTLWDDRSPTPFPRSRSCRAARSARSTSSPPSCRSGRARASISSGRGRRSTRCSRTIETRSAHRVGVRAALAARRRAEGAIDGRRPVPRCRRNATHAMNPALAALLAHPAIWRGDDCAPEPAAMPSGFARARRRAAGPRLAAARADRGAARARRHRRDAPHAARARAPAGGPAATSCGSRRRTGPTRRRSRRRASISRGSLIVRCRDARGRAVGVRAGAARARVRRRVRVARRRSDERVLRRLQVAAREGRTWGVLWRRPGSAARATAAPLRLALRARRPARGAVLKRRGGELAQPLNSTSSRAGRPPPPRHSPGPRSRRGCRPAPESRVPIRAAAPAARTPRPGSPARAVPAPRTDRYDATLPGARAPPPETPSPLIPDL